MAYDNALFQQGKGGDAFRAWEVILVRVVILPYRGAGLKDHLPDGGRGLLKVIRCPGILKGKPVIIILEVRKPYIHIVL